MVVVVVVVGEVGAAVETVVVDAEVGAVIEVVVVLVDVVVEVLTEDEA